MIGYFVYMFLDEDEDVLYIGSSIHLVKRIESQHFLSQHGNLSEDCILETHKVLYHQGVSESDMKVKERYLINTLAPKHNNKMNNNDIFSFAIDNIDWKLYSLDFEGLIEKRYKKIEIINHSFNENSSHLLIGKSNRKNYLRISRSKTNQFWQDVYFIKIENEFYFHNLNNLSSYAGYSFEGSERVYSSLERINSVYGLNSLIWVDSNENDNVLFRHNETDFFHPEEGKILSDKRDKKLLFIKYNLLRKIDFICSDEDIKYYNSMLGINDFIEREISF